MSDLDEGGLAAAARWISPPADEASVICQGVLANSRWRCTVASMTDPTSRSITPDLAALRALSHPTRLRILTHLRLEGPATATRLGARFGLHSGAASYHLRQLSEHGFIVEDAERGNARDRWWKSVHEQTVTRSRDAVTPEARETADTFWRSAAVMYTERMHAAMDERPLLPAAWRDASMVSDWAFEVPAHRAEDVVQQIRALLESVNDEPGAGSAPFVVQVQAFPIPGHVGPAAPAS